MHDILKDFAMVDRREYLPSCPVCGLIFTSSSALVLLSCRHFFCPGCTSYFLVEGRYQCPLCEGQSEEVKDGAALGESIAFLASWVQAAQDPEQKEYVIGRLLDDVVMVRRNLNFNQVPCRIQVKGQCPRSFSCPCDHELTQFRKKLCPKVGCHNEQCLFVHSTGEEVKTQSVALEVAKETTTSQNPPVKRLEKKVQKPGPGKQPAKSNENGCCTVF